MADQRLLRAAVALVVVQIVHGAIPAKTKAEGHVGLVLGVIALVASLAAVFGLRAGQPWARLLLGVTGAAVAVGFVLYHSLPVHSAVTNPYFGTKGIGALQWAPVIGAIGIGSWAAVEALRAGSGTASEQTAASTSPEA